MSAISVVKVKIDGTPVQALPGTAKLSLGGVSRKAIMTANGRMKFSETPMASKLVFDVLVDEDTDVDLINDCFEKTVEAVGDNGVTYTLQPATRTGDPIEIDASDSKASVTIEGLRSR